MNEQSELEKKWAHDETLQAVRFRENEEVRKREADEMRAKYVSPPGAIPNLSPVLEYRRLEYGIPDMFFSAVACNNKINVFQIDVPGSDGETYGDGPIVKAGWVQDRDIQSAPKGIIVSAGLEAMDNMYTNGYWIGHCVNFITMNPYRKEVGIINGIQQYVLCMTAGDITDSDDLASYVREGWVKPERREWKDDDGTSIVEHYWSDTRAGQAAVFDPSSIEDLEQAAKRSES